MNKNLIIALCTTFLAFCTLYTPQPLLPLLSAEFGVSAAHGALLVTVTLAPLGFAPIVYGYFLQAIPARTMLRSAVLLLIINQLIFFFATEFWHLLVLRFAQGLLIPAILTSLMTYCAQMVAPKRVKKIIGLYVGTTILGGFFSRFLGGWLGQWLGWHEMFLLMGLMLIPVYIALRYIDADAQINFQRLDLHSIKRVIATRLYRNSYLILFGCFFVFSGLLNLLPFRLHEISPSIGALATSLLYAGYLIGIPLAVASERLTDIFGGVRRALLVGIAALMLGLLAYSLPLIALLFATMTIFAGGMFFVHSVLSGMLNALAVEHKGVINGLYVSAYYLSGALGSWLVGYIYLIVGWEMLLLSLALLLAANMALVVSTFSAKHNKHHPKHHQNIDKTYP